jgi:hypothetical protein
MGMFDSFILNTKCPYCGEVKDREFQTKDFECELKVWKQGEAFLSKNITIIEGIIYHIIGRCNSVKCREYQKEKTGYNSGSGRSFYCDVMIKDQTVNGAINIKGDSTIRG